MIAFVLAIKFIGYKFIRYSKSHIVIGRNLTFVNPF